MTQWGLDTLFNPAKRHMDEEKRRQQSTREETGDSSGGKRIDLESGKVVIARSSADAGENDLATSDEHDASEPPTETSQPRQPAAAEPARKLTPAQVRAAQRRGRQAR